MNKALAPQLEQSIGDYSVLWFPNSNTYSVVDCNFKAVLDLYLEAPNIEAFYKALHHLPATDLNSIAKQLKDYLHSCQIEQEHPVNREAAFNKTHRNICKSYQLAHKTITLYADKAKVLKAVDAAIAHCEIPFSSTCDTVFDIYVDQGHLHLFQDERFIMAVPKTKYHFIQGKFHLLLSNSIHEKTEKDWLGTLHASTITDGTSAIAFIGQSGSGKSTLCSLLVAHGYQLLADDISPLGARDVHMYYNPSGISIKEHAFTILEPLFPQLKDLPEVSLNTSKGIIKYLPCPAPSALHFPCKTMVLVDYNPNNATVLEPISVKTALEIFIPDSWIHPGEPYASTFLNWLSNLKYFKLSYSDHTEMIKMVDSLFTSN